MDLFLYNLFKGTPSSQPCGSMEKAQDCGSEAWASLSSIPSQVYNMIIVLLLLCIYHYSLHKALKKFKLN